MEDHCSDMEVLAGSLKGGNVEVFIVGRESAEDDIRCGGLTLGGG